MLERLKLMLTNVSRRIFQQNFPSSLSAGFIFIAILLWLIFTWGSPSGWGLDDKTRWDWLNLLGSPLLLSVFGFWLQQWQKNRDKIQHAEEIVQEYFDQLSSLLIDKDILSSSGRFAESFRSVVRARTLMVLRRLAGDCERKSCVISFLSETGILSGLKVSLSGADLEDVNLDEIDLSDTILIGAKLTRSKLRGANLAGSTLSSIDIKGDDRNKINLTWRILAKPKQGANLSGADLRKAYLVKADLKGVNLTGADLRGAILGIPVSTGGPIQNGASLKGADLKGILWDDETLWPDISEFQDAKNMPISLKRKLDTIASHLAH